MVFTNRIAFWYGLSGTFLFGGILGFVDTSQPIYVGVYKLGVFFPLAFGATAVVAAIASSGTPLIVDRRGVHRAAHGAAVVSTATCTLWLAFSVAGFMPFWLFIAMVAIFVVILVVLMSTTTSLAMQPLGDVAGTASAVFGAMQTVGGAVLGYFVAQAFNGAVVPIVGALLVFDLCILACLLVAETADCSQPLDRSPPSSDRRGMVCRLPRGQLFERDLSAVNCSRPHEVRLAAVPALDLRRGRHTPALPS